MNGRSNSTLTEYYTLINVILVIVVIHAAAFIVQLETGGFKEASLPMLHLGF